MPLNSRVSIAELHERKYASVLCYPRYSEEETEKRIEELKRLSVEAIEFSGEKRAFDLPVVGKGHVGIVVVGHRKHDRVALKIRRVDADRKGMEHEAQMLSKANSVRIGPLLLGSSEDFLLMEYIEGKLLPIWLADLKGRGSSGRVRGVLLKALIQCWELDKLGLDHGELSRAPRHIIVNGKDWPHIVDFETASVKRGVSNVSSFCQYLFLGSELSKTLRARIGVIKREDLIPLLRNYKHQKTEQNFAMILQTLKLAARCAIA